MSLLSSLILPHLEKELLNASPEISQFLIQQAKIAGSDILSWAEDKVNKHIQQQKQQIK